MQQPDALQPFVPGQDDPLGPLPAGWQMQKAPNGKIFFIDHNTKKTSWVSYAVKQRLIVCLQIY